MPTASLLEQEEKALRAKLQASEGVDSSDDDDEDTDDKALSQLKQAVSKGGNSGSSPASSRLSNASRLSRKLRSHPGQSVLYLGHLPRELEEKDLAHFLKQFGRVVHIRIARSKKTGNPKGYAFVQMASEETAGIVANTLTGYILLGKRRLVCHVVPPERVHRTLFFKAQPPHRPTPPNRSSLAKLKQVTSRLVARERKKKALLEAAGIDYDFPGYEAGAGETTAADDSATPPVEAETDAVVEETSPSKKKKKRKDSVDSSSSKKRKESVDSSSGKKRKDSIDSSKGKKRKDSIDSSSSKRKKKTDKKKG